MMDMLDIRCELDDNAGLLEEIQRRNKIINALMYQVESNVNAKNTDYKLFQSTYLLEEQVKERTEALRNSVEFIELFMENAPVAIVFINEGRIVRHNHKFVEIFQYPDATESSPGILFSSPQEYADFLDEVATLQDGGRAFHRELYLYSRTREAVWVNVIGYATRAHDVTHGMVWMLEDRSRFKNAENELLRHHEILEEKVRARTVELSQQLHFEEQLIDAIPGPVFYKDKDFRYLGCNKAFEAYIGMTSAELIGKTPYDIAPKELADSYVESDIRLFKHPGSEIYESKVLYADVGYRDVIFHKATFTNKDGTVGGLVGLMLDITDRKKMEDDLRQAATFFESSAEGVVITDKNTKIIATNSSFSRITGYSSHDVIGKSIALLESSQHNQDFYKNMWDKIIREGKWQGEAWGRHKSGNFFPGIMSYNTVLGDDGEISNYVATILDATEKKRNEEEILRLSFSDKLTGLANRELLIDRLHHAIKSCVQSGKIGALYFIDLDGFKDINDTLGHDIGDLLLQQTALRLRDCVRSNDTVARFGGDEFVIMQEFSSSSIFDATQSARSAGEKVREAISATLDIRNETLRITPSIGVTLFGLHNTTPEELLKEADLAMYQAKRMGRDALCFYDPEMQKAVLERVALESELKNSIANRELVIYYQPQWNSAGRIIGAEALLRWQHSRLGMISPAKFIPLAEETGFIVQMGSWVLEQVCMQLRQWRLAGEAESISIAVNVSAQQMRQENFVEHVKAILDEHECDGMNLKLEITESLFLDDLPATVVKMCALKALGLKFSLDDFGSGYSSLNYLKRLPIDQLKIDQSFVKEILSDPNDAAIAKTIVALADTMGFEVIAEGVETRAQLDFLQSIHCDLYQGYLLSRPVPVDAFVELLTTQASRMP
ncbi:sensor domain-containing protein [Aquitalea aquatilis]|uniref:sensor domain-containing protein n=1 Tax=Aquitalea aquatilis TaxID=1537400 RepID=UPI0010BD50A6|nr:EAL domain-containing protein [Aquitalea aquatilis]